MRRLSEDQTRKQLIDPQLEKAGWFLRDYSKVKIEVPVGVQTSEVSGTSEVWKDGVADYCLYRENGEVLAVVEAKKTVVDVPLAEAQLTHYVTEIEKHQSFRPFGFLANGREIHFVDVGYAPRREVAGFFTREDLENLLYLRQHAQPLGAVSINPDIVDRSYQHEAIRRVCEAFEQHRPEGLEPSGRLAALQAQIAPLQSELDRLTRQFWVTKEQVKANKYDLSASRYRQVEADAAYHESPAVTLERLARLEQVIVKRPEG